MAAPSQARILVAVLVIGALALLITDALFYRQNRDLRAEVSEGRTLLPRIGERMPALRGVGVSGKPLSIRYGAGRKQLLLFAFSTQCEICDMNWPGWRALLGRLDLGRFRPVFVSVAPDLTRADVEAYGIGRFPVFKQLDPSDLVAYNIQIDTRGD